MEMVLIIAPVPCPYPTPIIVQQPSRKLYALTPRVLLLERLSINPTVPIDVPVIKPNGLQNCQRNQLLQVEEVVDHPKGDYGTVDVDLSLVLPVVEEGVPQVHVRRD
jgi:hypothetical protein